jgi:phage-related protein
VGDADRVVYTIKADTVFVLHAFKKKSTRGGLLHDRTRI